MFQSTCCQHLKEQFKIQSYKVSKKQMIEFELNSLFEPM